MIFVTGGEGYVGPEIARGLVRAGQRVRLLVTSSAEAEHVEGPGREIIVGDRRKPSTFASALEGADAAVLITRNARDLPEQESEFARTAKAAGVSRLVKLSAFGADLNAEEGAQRSHAEAEEVLRRSGVAWTFLRPEFFMQNLLWFADEIRAKGTFSLPLKDGRLGMIDFRDIAAVAIKCALDAAHEGHIYELSGPELLSMNDVAKKLARAVSVSIRYNDISPDEFERLLIAMGRPAWRAREIAVSYAGMSGGASAVVTDDVTRILGRAATPFDQVARDYARFFRATA
jgi:uncharacterized protein YbjT (DUF2867 family)